MRCSNSRTILRGLHVINIITRDRVRYVRKFFPESLQQPKSISACVWVPLAEHASALAFKDATLFLERGGLFPTMTDDGGGDACYEEFS